MNSVQFIKDKLHNLVKTFKNIKVRYEFDEMAVVHTVEILPKEIFYNNNDYIEWEDNMVNTFIEKFPCENIGFISEDALVPIENPSFIWSSNLVNVNSTTHNNVKIQTQIKEQDISINGKNVAKININKNNSISPNKNNQEITNYNTTFNFAA